MSEWLNLAMYLFFSAAIGAAVSAGLLHKKHRQALLSEVEAAETLAKAQGFQEGSRKPLVPHISTSLSGVDIRLTMIFLQRTRLITKGDSATFFFTDAGEVVDNQPGRVH